MIWLALRQFRATLAGTAVDVLVLVTVLTVHGFSAHQLVAQAAAHGCVSTRAAPCDELIDELTRGSTRRRHRSAGPGHGRIPRVGRPTSVWVEKRGRCHGGPDRRVAGRRWGNNFRWLWSAVTVSNLGDGVVLAAGPLLVASITQEPFAVSMAVFLQRLPWLLFGLFAGALVDRVDRRALVIIVDLLRALVLGTLAVFIWAGTPSLTVMLTAMFLLGTAEAFSDNASTALVPTVVPKADLGLANSRIFGSLIVTNQLAGPPIGAILFGLGAALPFGVNALCFLLSVVLMSRMRLVPSPRTEERISVRHEVGEGLRWLWAHAPVRTLAITITAFNITFGAAFSVWVLYAQRRLGLDDFGFGLLLTASAIGGLFGAGAYRRLERRVGLAGLMRIGLVIETLSHLWLAVTTVPWVAGVVMLVFGIHATVWGTTSVTVRQRAVPERLMGRVSSVYLLGSVGATALGTLLGGWIAQHWGVTAPFWFAFIASAAITVVMWRSFANITHTDEPEVIAESGP